MTLTILVTCVDLLVVLAMFPCYGGGMKDGLVFDSQRAVSAP